MSINVFLTDGVMKLEGFTTTPRTERGQTWQEYSLPGVKLFRDKGRFYTMLSEPTDPVPPVVAGVVDEISYYERLPGRPNREAGLYRCGTAEAEVESDTISGVPQKSVHIKAKNMGDACTLIRKIKTGSIRPDESYEGQQSGLSRATLEQELERLGEELSGLREVEATRNTLLLFATNLSQEKWPFCSKKRVARVIRAILTP